MLVVFSMFFPHYLQGFMHIQNGGNGQGRDFWSKKNSHGSGQVGKKTSQGEAHQWHQGSHEAPGFWDSWTLIVIVPFREWIHIPPNGKRKNHLQKCHFLGDMLVSGKVFVVTFFGVELGCKTANFLKGLFFFSWMTSRCAMMGHTALYYQT